MFEPDAGEEHLHGLFASLRHGLVDVAEGFASRVRERTEDAERSRAPVASDVFMSMVVEVLNMLASALGGFGDDEDDDDLG